MTKLNIVAALILGGTIACSKADKSPVDSALSVAPTMNLDSISALEQNQAAALQTPVAPAAPIRRSTSPTRRSSGSSGSTSSRTSGSSGSTSSGTTTIKKNTKRDAAIGAAAGAVIGATTSGDKVKGAVIGGVVGGVLGGVIGNNVDVKKKKK
jgi:hypothetical protein